MKLRFRTLINCFFCSVLLGSGIGFGSIYLFHLILLFTLIFWALLESKQFNLHAQNPRSIFFGFIVFMFIWYAMTLLWTMNIKYTLIYLFYILLGLSIVSFSIFWMSSKKLYAGIFRVLSITFIVHIVVCLLEIFTPFRLPTSPYSNYAFLFRRQTIDIESIAPEIGRFMEIVPTGFHGNPNNLAVAMAITLPYFLFLKNNGIVKFFGIIAILLIVISTGSKGSFLAILAGLIYYVFMRSKLYFTIIGIVVISSFTSISMNIEKLRNSDNPRIAEIGQTAEALSLYLFSDYEESGGGSISKRQLLIRNGLDALWETWGLGVGGGASKAVQEQNQSTITSMHNFWIEILVEGGVIFFFLFVIWYVSLIIKLNSIFRHSCSDFFRYHAASLTVSLIIFSVGCISASTAIYFLPMWLMFGLAISLIMLYKTEKKKLNHKFDIEIDN